MKFLAAFAALATVLTSVVGQQPSLCDKYTTALLMNNTAENQQTVLTLVVNTALIGNYTNPAGPAKNAVTGILNPGQYNGSEVDLLQYFNGSLLSTNRDGNPTSVNFLDGGGAAPLMQNKAADNESSNQYTLVTHLYQIFGTLLGCSMQNSTSVFKNYEGMASMSQVHRFMNLDPSEMGYFVQEVGSAATSFGVTSEDAMAVGTALNTMFNQRCLPPASLGGGAPAASQSCCLASMCPLAENAQCDPSGQSFGNGTAGVEPQAATTTTSSSGGSGGGDGTSSLAVNVVGALALAAAGFVAISL